MGRLRLALAALVALMPAAAEAASCIASNLIITEVADPATVPEGVNAANARFIQL